MGRFMLYKRQGQITNKWLGLPLSQNFTRQRNSFEELNLGRSTGFGRLNPNLKFSFYMNGPKIKSRRHRNSDNPTHVDNIG